MESFSMIWLLKCIPEWSEEIASNKGLFREQEQMKRKRLNNGSRTALNLKENFIRKFSKPNYEKKRFLVRYLLLNRIKRGRVLHPASTLKFYYLPDLINNQVFVSG
jgi:hypothetical protein